MSIKKTTLKDVAEYAGVSKATVSYVLNGKNKRITKETREKVEKAVKKLNYVPNLGAASLISNSSRLIGVVIPQTEPGSELMFRNPFYSEILSSIEYNARKNGYHIIISATDINESYLRLIMERSLDGVIVIGMYPNEFYRQFKEIDIPIVLIDSYCKEGGFHNVRIDDEHGGYIATRYLLDKGHKNIAAVCGIQNENGVVNKRISGYRRALAESGIECRDELIIEDTIDYDSGVRAAKIIANMDTPVSAVITTADILAIGVMKGLHIQGINVPEEISVMGFDDLEVTAYLPAGLTTVRQDIALKGKAAIDILCKGIEDSDYEKQDMVLPCEIVERESVRDIK